MTVLFVKGGNGMTDNEKLDLILSEMQNMKRDMQDMRQDMQDMKQDISDIKQKVTKMDLVIENELRVNIQRVAEGHLDLSRNLHEAMKPSSEVEMLAIKVRMLESDVRDLKLKLA